MEGHENPAGGVAAEHDGAAVPGRGAVAPCPGGPAAVPPRLYEMAVAAARRDGQTPNHLQRMQHYVAALARRLQGHPRYASALGDEQVALLFRAAALHDIGKADIPEAILHKPGRLTAAEFAEVKRHTVHGRAALDRMAESFGDDLALLHLAREIAYSHHERHDGSGYPEGLAGDAIPVPARLVAVADVYDALISRRAYKPPFTHATAVELIRQGGGEHFDQDAVDAMLAAEEEFEAIARRFGDDGLAPLPEAPGD